MPAIQASACHGALPRGCPLNQPRSEFTVTVTGLWLAKPRSQDGMPWVGTNADEANVSGNSQMKPPDCAASTLLTDRPISTPIQENPKLNASVRASPAIVASTEPWNRNPGIIPTTIMLTTFSALPTTSEGVRPTSSPCRAIG